MSLRWEPRIKGTDIANLLHALGVMLRAGLPLDTALQLQARQESNGRLQRVLEGVSTAIAQEGIPLSVACSRFPRVFSATVVALMRVGESSGNLAQRLNEARAMLERQHRMGSEIRRVLVGPCITLVCCMLMLWVIVAVLVPRLAALYADLKVDMPAMSVIVLGTISQLCQPVTVVVAIVAAVGMGRTRARWIPVLITGSLRWHFTRHIVGIYLATTFCSMLGHLYKEGVALTDSLDLLIGGTTLPVYEKLLKQVRKSFHEHGDLATALEVITFFPPAVASMMRIGQETGQVDKMLLTLSRLLEEETEAMFRDVVTLLEPAFMTIFGLLLGVIFVSLFLPIYGLLAHLQV